MVSREALELDELLRNAPKAVNMDLQHQREAGEHAEDMTSEPEGVRFEDAPTSSRSTTARSPRSRRGRSDDRGVDALTNVLTSTSASQLLAC